MEVMAQSSISIGEKYLLDLKHPVQFIVGTI